MKKAWEISTLTVTKTGMEGTTETAGSAQDIEKVGAGDGI
jgi:hypothetical protein